jgi:hypothetical protein
MISGKGTPMNVIHNEPCNVQPMLDLFGRAKLHLKKPSLKFEINPGAGERLVFYIAGLTSKYAGMIMISNGKMFNDPENKWFGYITNNVHDAIYFTQQANEWNKQVIKNFVENPLGNAVLNGKEFCNCCFCGIELTSKESLHAGYGPICAENWGLPWGETGEVDKMSEAFGEIEGLSKDEYLASKIELLQACGKDGIMQLSTSYQLGNVSTDEYKFALIREIANWTSEQTSDFSQLFREENV